MTETEKLNIKRARLALLDHKDQEALDYYLEANEENTNNSEAAYWVYTAYWEDCINNNRSASEKWKAFVVLSGRLTEAVDQIAEMEGTDMEKAMVLIAFVYAYTPIVDYVTGYLGAQMATPQDRIERAVLTLYQTGNAIEHNFSSNEEAMKMASEAWKEAVKLQQKFYAYKYNGSKVEDYVEKIRKVEPDYVVPKKAGCISLG